MTEENIPEEEISQPPFKFDHWDKEFKYAIEIPFVQRTECEIEKPEKKLTFKYDYQDQPIYNYDDLINKSNDHYLPEDCKRNVLDHIYTVLEIYWKTEQYHIKQQIKEFQFCSKNETLTVIVNKNTPVELANDIFNKLYELSIGQNNEMGDVILDSVIVGYDYIGPGNLVYISVLYEGFIR